MTPANNNFVPKKAKLWFSKRFFIVVLLFFGVLCKFSLRANLSIAIVEMTSPKIVQQHNQTIQRDAEFDWDSKTKGLILSVYSYGYLLTVFGGYFATRFGGASIYTFTLLMSSVLTLLTPLCTRLNFYLFLAIRIVEGLFEGLSYSSISEIFSRWAPANERSTLISYGYTGAYIASSTTFPFCGYLAERWGWPMVFYVTGSIGLTWGILWYIFVSNDPATDKWISQEEKLYLQQEVECTSKTKITYPWKEIITSRPVLALCIGKFTYACGHTLFGTCFPLYIKDVTGTSVDIVGMLSGIPNIISIFAVPIAGHLVDYLQNNSGWSTTKVHKILLCSNAFLDAVLFIATVFIRNFTVLMVLLIGARTLLSFTFLVMQLVPIYLAPFHSSMIAGFSGAWYTVCAIITPTAFGYLVENHSASEWSICFIITGIISAFGGFWFMLFGSSEIQPWAKLSEDEALLTKCEVLNQDNDVECSKVE